MTRNLLKILTLLPLLFSSAAFSTPPKENILPPAEFETAAPLAAANEQITFLYYSDLAAAREYYGNTLGLQSYYDQEWVSLYRVTSTATIGVVKLGREDLLKSHKRDAVMISIVTQEIDTLYETLRKKPGIVLQKEIYNHPAVPIRAFLLEDPEGYSIEFLQWRE